MYAVKRTSIWGRVAARQHGADTAKGVEAHLTVGRSEARCRSVTAKASCPEIERSTGARVGMSVAEVGEKHLLLARPR